MSLMDGKQNLIHQQASEVVAQLGFEQESMEAFVHGIEVQERLQVTTFYLHVLCPLPRRLEVLAQASTYFASNPTRMAPCVSQGNTEEGTGFLVFASQYPFHEGDLKWLVQHLGVDAYRSTVSVDIDLRD